MAASIGAPWSELEPLRRAPTWQIVPARLQDALEDPDRARARRVMEAMLRMKNLEIAELERAYRG